jgi:glycosyltransferase involved in cell wall biosynthesis
MIVHCNSEFWWFREQFGEAAASYSGARRVFCVSRNNLDLLGLQLGERLRNAELVRNPYNVSTQPPPPWPDVSSGWRLACVARLELAAKGQDLLLQTLAGLQWRDRPIEVNLFGAGPDEAVLRRLGALLQLPNVRFRGHVQDIRAIWEKHHLLLLPSRYEGLPLSLVEAMWCGRPAVVTDAGGNAELCADNETGFVARAASVGSYSEALEKAWERREEWPQMGEAARRRVEEQIPKDPVGIFCERLQACAAASGGEESGI